MGGYFCQKNHTERQTAYNKTLGKYGVFTPQIIINGRQDGIGSREELVQKLINEARDNETSGLKAAFKGTRSHLSLKLSGVKTERELLVRIVYYSGQEIIQVGNGDNTGKSIGLTNVVMASSIIGKWSRGDKTISIDTAFASSVGADCIAILIQDGDTGPILAADKIILSSLEKV